MSLVFSIPGKTFLAGEYLALQGGPTLVFLSEPRFELEVTKGTGLQEGLHPDSPAGVFMRKDPGYFAQFNLKFKDPYQSKGGFGASTSQFLAVYALWLMKEDHHQDMEKILDFKHLLESYYEVAWNGEGQRPSGADLVGQLKGSCTFFEKRQGLISVKSWPFTDLDFSLIHTGHKMATHEHLKTLGAFNGDFLEKAFAKIKQSFDVLDSSFFIEGITAYRRALASLGLTCQETLALLEKLDQVPGVLATKGCGALGADVVLVVTEKNNKEKLLAFCAEKKLLILTSSEKISAGLQVRGSL